MVLTNNLIVNDLKEKRENIIKSIKEFEQNPENMETNKDEFIKLCIDLTNLNVEIKSIRYK